MLTFFIPKTEVFIRAGDLIGGGGWGTADEPANILARLIVWKKLPKRPVGLFGRCPHGFRRPLVFYILMPVMASTFRQVSVFFIIYTLLKADPLAGISMPTRASASSRIDTPINPEALRASF